jgi:hypothetical protein
LTIGAIENDDLHWPHRDGRSQRSLGCRSEGASRAGATFKSALTPGGASGRRTVAYRLAGAAGHLGQLPMNVAHRPTFTVVLRRPYSRADVQPRLGSRP